MLAYKNHPRRKLVSVLFHNQLSKDISHVILDENEDIFQQLVKGNFRTKRHGKDFWLEITSETEMLRIRQITRIPMFMNF